jgi:phosphoribosylformylglycinamidine synthase
MTAVGTSDGEGNKDAYPQSESGLNPPCYLRAQMTVTSALPQADLEMAEQLGLIPEEYHRIVDILGREPNFTELSMYAVMWSEHCSYKNSIKWLKTLPREGPGLLAEPGKENAGLVDIGDGLACAFKIESHNHPSAIEPYQGAATGVGGIHRDIFTMGARPIASLNSLRFGELDSPRTKRLLKGVVKGIGDYGNAFGIPTVGGEVYFDKCYETNPLVNAMSIGIVEHDKVVSAVSKGAGNPVYIVGSSTGKDGIHGATFASEDISEDSAEKLPSVQVGDPFMEKLLLEASMEAIATGGVVGMQDMGAAGITCSTSEMSEKGGFGMNVWLDRVPTRQENMQAWEILLSESQERMLVVVRSGMTRHVEEVFEKWDLNYAVIGEVTEGGELHYYMGDELVASVPAESLVLGGGAPVYERAFREPEYYQKLRAFRPDSIEQPAELRSIAEALVQIPTLASKRWITTQYDSMVGLTNRTTNDLSDAAVIRIRNSKKALLATTDCNSRYVWADPFVGGMIAVSECARNITCAGGRPLAVTNCLNFGNPYDQEVYWQFVHAVKGMGEACRKFNTPVTGGNVSFYNQSADGGAVFPTPTIGMIGVLDDPDSLMTLSFRSPGHLIYLIGPATDDLGSSQYLARIRGVEMTPAPWFDLDVEQRVQQALAALIDKRVIASAHDVSEGGLFVTLLECAMGGMLGFEATANEDIRKDAWWFGESQSRIAVSVPPEAQDNFFAAMDAYPEVDFEQIGTVTASGIEVDHQDWGVVSSWRQLYENAIERQLALSRNGG